MAVGRAAAIPSRIVASAEQVEDEKIKHILESRMIEFVHTVIIALPSDGDSDHTLNSPAIYSLSA
jgi:hypothetical protein